MGKVLFLTGISLVVCAMLPASGTSWYVNGSLPDSGNGQSWETAFKTIQEGIDAATDGDSVAVAEGTYLENVHLEGKNITLTSTDPLDAAVVANTIIDGNQAGSVVTFSGTEDETCVLSGFTIHNGSAEYGGGICGGSPDDRTGATIQNNTIADNSVYFNGGGLAYCEGVVQNNTIAGNTADFGGGLYHCNGTIRNNLVTGNSGGSGGGLYDCNATLRNNTISGNSATVFGGGLRLCRGTIQNCVVWGNTAAYDAQLSRCSEPTYSCIHGWEGFGEGNISEDPLFVDADGPDDNLETYRDNNYHLASGSPCTDAGKNEDWMSEATDLDGNDRIRYGLYSLTVDMGAYEYLPSRIIRLTRPTSDRVQLEWTSSPGFTYTIWWCVDLLSGGWVEETTIPSQGQTTSWTDIRTLRRTKFYRIEVK